MINTDRTWRTRKYQLSILRYAGETVKEIEMGQTGWMLQAPASRMSHLQRFLGEASPHMDYLRVMNNCLQALLAGTGSVFRAWTSER